MDIAPAAHFADARRRAPTGLLHQIARARTERLGVEPHQCGFDGARFAWRGGGIDDEIAARDVDLVDQLHGYGIAGDAQLARRSLDDDLPYARAPA